MCVSRLDASEKNSGHATMPVAYGDSLRWRVIQGLECGRSFPEIAADWSVSIHFAKTVRDLLLLENGECGILAGPTRCATREYGDELRAYPRTPVPHP